MSYKPPSVTVQREDYLKRATLVMMMVPIGLQPIFKELIDQYRPSLLDKDMTKQQRLERRRILTRENVRRYRERQKEKQDAQS